MQIQIQIQLPKIKRIRIPIRNSAEKDPLLSEILISGSGPGYASETDGSGKQKLWTEHCQMSHLKYCTATAGCSSCRSSFYPQTAGVCSPLQSSCVPDNYENFLLIQASLKTRLKRRQTNSGRQSRNHGVCYILDAFDNRKSYPF
jgi:hypothetical protein